MAASWKSYRDSIIINTSLRLIFGILSIYFYCEYLIYYVSQTQCDWPTLNSEEMYDMKPVRAMIIADTHLVPQEDQWFEESRNEQQMYQAFQTAIYLHKPEAVFVLGDLFDDGKWASDTEFNDRKNRFDEIFKVPNGTSIYVVAGSNDIGHHYSITRTQAARFECAMNAPVVDGVNIRGNIFVMINSMAMEEDGCWLCATAINGINRISGFLKKYSKLGVGEPEAICYRRPIILQHLPLYRESDDICQDAESTPESEKSQLLAERWDCLSKKATAYLVESLHPRLVFGGHTHKECKIQHNFAPVPNYTIDFTEYTVPSFSWRKTKEPQYYLVMANPGEVKVAKCTLPSEWTIQATGVALLIALILYLKWFSQTKNVFNYKKLSGETLKLAEVNDPGKSFEL